MITEKTPYTIEQHGERLSVVLEGRRVALGFTDKESAVKAVHVINGSNPKHFYKEIGGIVYLDQKVEEYKREYEKGKPING